MFQPVEGNVNFPQQELAVGEFWKANRIYEKSLAQREGAPPFVFYEGPPTANGMPHPGHCLTRAMKDLFPRYKTMRGYRCERKAGWDTHGLPVEVEVCKELGIHAKEEIEAYGIEPFIHKCQQSVWRYMREWERLTERLGFWIHLDEAYVTYHQSYVESVWWSLKNLFDRGLLYQGHKIVWWWAQGGTALSAGEVGQGYREVADPSVYVKFPLLDDAGNVTDTSLLVWTTTPWTLISNQFAAVHPMIEYATVVDHQSEEKLILAKDLVESIAKKTKADFEIVDICHGYDLMGKRYLPPFDKFYQTLGNQTGELFLGDTEEYLEKTGARSLQSAERDFFFDHKWNIPKNVENAFYDMEEDYQSWRIVLASFVTTESGSGIVHQAPAFGEVDYGVLIKEQQRFLDGQGPPLLNAVAPNGHFTDEAPEYCRGRWVKDCDKEIVRDLRDRGLLFHQEQYVHDYPFCWRAEEDPLIQYPRESWFIRTTAFKDQMLANNAKINWLPEHIKDGRFGNFLETNVDWALSRERYWGTPLPIWKCDKTGKMEAIGSYDELMAKPGAAGGQVWAAAKKKNPELPDDLRVHKPYIDAVTYDSPFAKGARMQRVSEVIDCWYDSGAMPFAQWGYRGQTTGPERDNFLAQFPADFISEAIDQTRGWFYSQLAISTLLFGPVAAGGSPAEASTGGPPVATYPHPFRNCIVLGLMLGEDGGKMSKSKRNYLAPDEIFDRYGADALRWYLFANQPPWTSIRYSEQAIKDSIPEFLLRLWNVYSFFVIYANIDGFDPEALGARRQALGGETTSASQLAPSAIADRGELDRWVLSELNRTAAAVVERMDAYDNFAACQEIIQFVDALSNWYVRRSRDRFWAADKRAVDKLDAYWTLYECLVTTAKLIAPFVPFLAESLWQNLSAGARSEERGASESVHLCDYPTGDPAVVDEALSARMNLVREISSLGRNARNAASLKVRQPLSKVEVVLVDTAHQPWLEEHAGLIAEELNVKAVEFTTHGEEYIAYSIVPNFKRLGPRLGKDMPAVKKELGRADAAKLLAELKSAGKIALKLPGGAEVELDDEDIEIRLQAKEGWAAAQGKGCVVVLATELTDELIAEGLARDVVRLIQDRRKEIGCEYTDRIQVGLVTDSAGLAAAIDEHRDYLAQETLAVKIVDRPLAKVEATKAKLAGDELAIYVQVTT
jgi:isoleucyl-tRNA synthetase